MTAEFEGFPGIARATSIPNLHFEAVLPEYTSPGALLAFLWVSRLGQEQRGEARCVDSAQIWASAAARRSFEHLAGGRPGLEAGLIENVELGALVSLGLRGQGQQTTVYFVNNPASRRAITRARAGQLEIRPGTAAIEISTPKRPGIFRLYEENIGTVTPMIAERLVAATDTYPADWIEDAFREAAERNVRNWRYIERILESWTQEGRTHEGTSGDSFEDQERRFLGGNLGHLARRP